ncbi:hypothetical protein [Sulfitobacter aestuariivivens]|uniref:Copper chaperone PCu(A)C n=1 Tax=Sulfitobacter aestuariivivens TaxID=2766981 RepID=A0A927D5W8_9RHOB|nr:hypothetical protein [Sulfitobacter aestuariivivens]MBD3665539.1 hypothetical protein [Sulfitobacter aestuariivivens]
MRTLALFAIGLAFGLGIGFVTAAGMGVTFDGHDHSNAAHHGAAPDGDHVKMHDTPIEVDAATAPTLAIDLIRDPKAGYNLHVMVENFEFSPRQASRDHAPGQGHAHVYVNGVKQGRLYGPWVHLDGLPKGTVAVEVTLNSNNHQPLAVNGEPIRAATMLEIE